MDHRVYSNNQKIISMPLGVIIMILVIIITLVSFKVYAKSGNDTVDENTNVEKSLSEIESLDDEETNTTNDVFVITVQSDNSTENNEIDNNEEESNEVDSSKTSTKKSTTSSSSSTVYKASNGETYTIIGNVSIPSLGIDYPILSSTSKALLKISVTKFWGADPNEVGNMVVAGHNYYGKTTFFGKLPNIKKGAIIKITDADGETLDYTVYDTDIVDPEDTSCTSQLTDGKIEVTLVTCYYEKGKTQAKQRFIVKARVEDT